MFKINPGGNTLITVVVRGLIIQMVINSTTGGRLVL